MELKVADQSLCVYVDDTGHEALVPGHPVYGLGGCAVMAADLDRLVRRPWHEVRRQIRGSANEPLHAANLGHSPRPQDIEAVASFFRSQPFARLGAVLPIETRRHNDIKVATIIAETLKRRILDIAKWTAFTELNVIFESSGRADSMIEEAFADFRLEEDGRPIPVECYFMPKAVHDPALEVADFIVHAVGRHARRRLEGRENFAPDFEAVFQLQDSKRVSFMEATDVQVGSVAASEAGRN